MVPKLGVASQSLAGIAMKLWQEAFMRGLEESSSEPQLYPHLDELLDWFSSSKSSEEPDTVMSSLLEMYGEQELRARFERFIERLIFHGNEVVRDVFSNNLSSKQAKRRYRKLMQVFHPDRGFNRQAWLTSRSEKINRAYQEYKDNMGARAINNISTLDRQLRNVKHTSVKPPAINMLRNLALRYNAELWRKRLGEPEKLLRKLAIGLIGVVSVILLLVLLA